MTEDLFTVISGLGTPVEFGDKDVQGEDYLFIDVKGRGTVIITAEDNGISVDIYPLHVTDGPIASTYVDMNDLVKEQ